MPEPGQSQGATDFENLLTEAVDAHERGGDAAVDELLRRHQDHAAGVRRALADLAHSGLLRAPSAHGVFPPRLGDFLLLERIGSGGMGVVFLAEQQSLRRKVAVKLVRPELLLSDVARERFQREIETIAQLQHPGIVPILAVGSEGGIPYFAMDYVAGRSLDDVLASVRERDPASLQGSDFAAATGLLGARTGSHAARFFAGSWWEACVRVVRAVAQTMAYVHARGIVHRDLKPSNVVVTPLGQTLLLDFGLAHMAHAERLTRSGAEVGSPAYMSPEQLRGDALDERTDIYSLCVTLHQLLALATPFSGSSSENLRQSILAGLPQPLRRSNGAVPRELEVVVRTGMDRDRDRRYRDMAALAHDLDAVLQRRPIAARPLSPGLRAVRWCQRHPAVATGLGVALAFACAFPLVLWALQRDTNARLDAALTLATADYGDARAAVERMLVEFGYSELHGVPQAEPLRADMLRTAVAFYERLLQRRSGDASLQAELAVARRALGTVLWQLGQVPAAIAELERALTVLDRPDLPRDGELPMHAAIAHKVLAKAFRDLDRMDDAELHTERMTAQLLRLRAERPSEFDPQIQLAEAENLRADVLGLRGRVAEQEACLRRALAAKRDLLRAFPDEPMAAQGLAVQCINLAEHLREQTPGRAPESDALHVEAIALLRERAFPPGELAMRDRLLAEALAGRGQLAMAHGALSAAQPLLTESLALCRRLAADFPTTARYPLLQVEATLRLAELRSRQGDWDSALRLAAEALAAAPPGPAAGTDRAWRQSLAAARARQVVALVALSRVDEACTLADALRRDPDVAARVATALACAALATVATGPDGPRRQARTDAIAALQAADRAGLLRQTTFAEPVLQPLLAEPEMAALRARHEAGVAAAGLRR